MGGPAKRQTPQYTAINPPSPTETPDSYHPGTILGKRAHGLQTAVLLTNPATTAERGL